MDANSIFLLVPSSESFAVVSNGRNCPKPTKVGDDDNVDDDLDVVASRSLWLLLLWLLSGP